MVHAAGSSKGTKDGRERSEVRLRLAQKVAALEQELDVQRPRKPLLLAMAVVRALEKLVDEHGSLSESENSGRIDAKVAEIIDGSGAFEGLEHIGWELLVGGWLRLPGEVYALVRSPSERIGDFHDGSTPNQTGAFFTPKSLVDELVVKTFECLDGEQHPEIYSKVEEFKLVEPAVGGGFFLIGWLVEALKRFEGGDGKTTEQRPVSDSGHPAPRRVDSEARAWLQRFLRRATFAVDVDPGSISVVDQVLALLQRCAGISPSRCVQSNLIVGDSLDPTVSHQLRGANLIIGNPPWLSYSGRQSHREDSKVEELCKRHGELSRWPSSHGAFVLEAAKHWLSDASGSMLALLLPATVAHLDGFEPVRALLRQRLDVREPLATYPENAFAGVVQESMALIAVRRTEAAPSDAKNPEGRPFALSRESSQVSPGTPSRGGVSGKLSALSSHTLDRLDAAPRPAPDLFGDIGVHTGNVAKKLICAEPVPGGVPVLEGKDVHPFRHDDPRRWLDLRYQPEESEYFRIANAERYRSARVLIRQTANRIIACGNPDGHYFRNSVLACFPPEEIPVSWILAWLNHEWISVYHQTRVYESGQRSFPQVKISHLRSLPAPDWSLMRSELGTSEVSREELAESIRRSLLGDA
jgi:hypothetical protein